MAKENTSALKKRIAELEAKLKKKVYLKVSKKGAVSLYGLRRFPITFYKSEWATIFEMEDEVQEFMKKHASELKGNGQGEDDEEEEEDEDED